MNLLRRLIRWWRDEGWCEMCGYIYRDCECGGVNW